MTADNTNKETMEDADELYWSSISPTGPPWDEVDPVETEPPAEVEAELVETEPPDVVELVT